MDDRLERLRKHVVGICTNLIWPEISIKGCILAQSGKGSVYEDNVTTHHLVDLLSTLDMTLFSETIYKACQWFAEENANMSDPFFVTTLSQVGYFRIEKKEQIVVETILNHRRESGLIEIFAGFLDGGSLFSTLWAIKILQYLEDNDGLHLKPTIRSALLAIRNRWQDLHRTSFKGFYLDLVSKTENPELISEADSICKEILESQDSNGLWDDSLLYSCYIAGNLIAFVDKHNNSQLIIEAVDRCLDTIFDLDNEATTVPTKLKDAKNDYSDSAYLQTIIRSVISAVHRLRRSGYDVSSDIAKALLGTWPSLYTTAGSLNSRLKRMMQQYGEIEDIFQKQQKSAKDILESSPYDRNVFIMMPFRQKEDDSYKDIEKIIKKELLKNGFMGWLASDKDLDSSLWGNITTYMTACKYGIAVFTRREDVGKGTIEPEFNPNVSLELGFMMSRGKRVLLLKDSFLKTLPTDIMGQLYKQFDLRKVRSDLPSIITNWTKEIIDHENKSSQSEL